MIGQRLQGLILLLKVAVSIAQKNIVSVPLGCILNAPRDFREEGVGDVADHQANGVGALRGQPPRHPIGAIAQLIDHRQYPLTRLVRQLTLVVDDAGDGFDRYPGSMGDIAHGYSHLGTPRFDAIRFAADSVDDSVDGKM
jgi:hypothetical protein